MAGSAGPRCAPRDVFREGLVQLHEVGLLDLARLLHEICVIRRILFFDLRQLFLLRRAEAQLFANGWLPQPVVNREIQRRIGGIGSRSGCGGAALDGVVEGNRADRKGGAAEVARAGAWSAGSSRRRYTRSTSA